MSREQLEAVEARAFFHFLQERESPDAPGDSACWKYLPVLWVPCLKPYGHPGPCGL